jgi:hypothetical protein
VPLDTVPKGLTPRRDSVAARCHIFSMISPIQALGQERA